MHYQNDKINDIDDLKSLFPKMKANSLNWCIFSTSGVHGSYFDLDEIEHSLKNNLNEYDTGYCDPILTVLVIKPRIVSLGWGNIEITLNDIPFLREIARSSLVEINASQKGNV